MKPARRKERIDRGIKVHGESIYALASPAEIAYVVAPRMLLVVGLLALPLVLSPWPYWSRIALTAGLVALLGMRSTSWPTTSGSSASGARSSTAWGATARRS